MTPIPFLGNTQVDIFEETVFNGSGYTVFTRPLNQYFFFTNIIISFYLFVIHLIAGLTFGYGSSTKLNDILSFALSPLYTIKALLKQNSIGTVIALICFSLFFFSSLISVTDLGWVTAINAADYTNDPDGFQSEYNSRNEIAQMENSIWYSLITMTTIGYGDMSVTVSLSRIVIVVVSIASAVFFPLFITAVENLLGFGYQEAMAFQVFNQVMIKNTMKETASILIQKNAKRVKILNQLSGNSRSSGKPKTLQNIGSEGSIDNEKEGLNKGGSNVNINVKPLTVKEEKILGIELKALQEEIFEIGKEFKDQRLSYRNNLQTDFTSENSLKLGIMNEYMEGIVTLANHHMKLREINPEAYPNDDDYKNYVKVMRKVAKPKTNEDRYYLRDLMIKEYGTHGKNYDDTSLIFTTDDN